MASRDELTAWALRAPVTGTRHAGAAASKLVLVALCQYADAEGVAWPSAQRLADDLTSTRRDVRNALTGLSDADLIERLPTERGGPMRWRLAGYPALSPTNGGRDTPPQGTAGRLAGRLAGDVAGYPAPNRREEKKQNARANCGHELIDDRHCTHGCPIADAA